MEKALQTFSDEYLQNCRGMTADQVVEFLEQFRQIAGAAGKSKTKLISVKVPEDLLAAFKTKAQLQGRLYQTIIKELMRAWLLS